MPTELNVIDRVEPDLTSIFDETSDWIFASIETCKREKLFPNMLAYCENQATLALIVKRSATGQDFALNEAGLNYLLAALDNGGLKDGSPVRHAFVVQADVDPQATSRQRPLKVVKHSTAHETREHLKGISPYPGNFSGPYWWLSPEDEGRF
jgi:hypothetical protein